MTCYIAEDFTPDEADVLRRYFTNLDGPVFALVNLPEVVKGALFARYSRSSKSLRRLFLDEFVGDLDITGDATIDATIGLRRAEELYDRGSEEHTSELQSLMRISYAVFCLKKKKKQKHQNTPTTTTTSRTH